MTIEVDSALATFRGGMPITPLDARRIASGLAQPGCPRRQLLDAAAVPIDEIASLLGCPIAGQSPFAIARGIAFEKQVFEDGMAELTAIVRTHLGQDVGALTPIDLSAHEMQKAFGTCDNALRVRETASHLTAMLAGKPGSGCLLRHAVFSLGVAGVNVYLEADALCFHTGGQLTIAEVKSFPAIDGVPDAAKTAAALLQSAVYVLALQETLTTLGYDPAIVSTRVLLVLTRNFSLKPVGFVRDIAPAVRRLKRRLSSLPVTADLATAIPSGVVLPTLPLVDAGQDERRRVVSQVEDAVAQVPCRFGDACGPCPLFRFCRDEARQSDAAVAAGSAVAEVCGDVHTVGRALQLAAGNADPSTPAEFAVAAHLGRAAAVRARILAAEVIAEST